MKTLDVIAAILLVVGGLSWGLVAAVGLDIDGALGGPSLLGRFFYGSIGLAGVYQALTWKEIQKRWALAWARW